MTTLPEAILERSKLLPEGGVLTPKEFLHLGSRAAVDQAFSRLAKTGLLLRAARGLYLAATTDGRDGKGTPAMAKVVQSLASKTLYAIAIDGAASAKLLGLTSHAPDRNAFLTNGRSRTLKLGDVTAQISRAPRWMLSLASSTAGTAIRAMAWLGEARVNEAIQKLRGRLSYSDWQAMGSVRSLLPSWMALAIGREVA